MPNPQNFRSQNSTGLLSLTASKLLETLLNEAIRLDEQHGEAFKVLPECVIQLHLHDFQTDFYLLCTDYGISVQNALAGEADACIQTEVAELVALRRTGQLNNALLSGDEVLATQFIQALANLDIDWEEHLSHYTGDLIAFKVGHAARSFAHATENAKQQAADTLKEYLQFELQALPTQDQVMRFADEVNRLQEQTDAIAERIEQLLNKHPPKADA